MLLLHILAYTLVVHSIIGVETRINCRMPMGWRIRRNRKLNSGYYEFKYLYDNWSGQEYFNMSTSDSICTVIAGQYINRATTIGTADTALPVVCFEECYTCAAAPPPSSTFNVTLEVNTANITVGPNGIYAGGGFLGGSNAYPMDDSDSDDVWVVTIPLDSATASGGKFIFLNSPNSSAD